MLIAFKTHKTAGGLIIGKKGREEVELEVYFLVWSLNIKADNCSDMQKEKSVSLPVGKIGQHYPQYMLWVMTSDKTSCCLVQMDLCVTPK